jgi:hypothetical protein
MSDAPEVSVSSMVAQPGRRPPGRAIVFWIRRGHLYFGLFLAPWALLYGVTAFLFNHPTAFSDQPTATFGAAAIAGTPLETPPAPDALAARVVAELNAVQKPATPYRLAGPAKFGPREFAFATVRADGQTVSVLVDIRTGGGTVRAAPNRERAEGEKAPFATGSARGRSPGGPPRADAPRAGDAILLDDPIHERIRAAIPTILERTGFPAGAITVTSVPDLVFPIAVGERVWTATYNPMTGAVGGAPADVGTETEFSPRRFLLRLHLAHGYPGEVNGRWFWALIVDLMAFALCFWAMTGLILWWQIKATRRLGAILLALSAAAATLLGFLMHAMLAG